MIDNGNSLNGSGKGHMTPEQVSAYLARTLPNDRREEFERHLLVCAECRGDLADASTIGVTSSRRWLTVGAPLAAAAALVLLIANPFAEPRAADPLLRDGQSAGMEPLSAVAPANGARVSMGALVFQWRRRGEETFYELTLTDANGDVVFNEGTSDTLLILPRSVGLQPEATYFWYVDALLTGARSVTTGVHEFVVTR
jgi:hypothetical protein